ncbi:DNA-binding response regulator [Nitrospira sp. KM1]|uniref:sigma-54-dependent transcriptional regulator n=1 Tax=Nitrospira sp. KM1 TaxID=1936990 RepID=UPI0013A7379D|nr:sigma-54 dependent transcriptional regulator [Nitrospira sp. KM1]BCA54033.1 DNA-binding response regulator [Nitrospira sp. KM1]
MGIAGKILIVDDEEDALENCRRILSRVPYDCVATSNPGQAMALLEREHPGLVLTDLRMPKMDGIEVLTAAKRVDPAVQVVLLTAHATIETAVTSMRYGAFDYITKPFTGEELLQVVRRAFDAEAGGQATATIRSASVAARPSSSGSSGGIQIVGSSASMKAVLALADRVAPTDSNVLVYGESGTGKEMLARYIHKASRRTERALIPVDCVSLNDSLLESELFGHEKGAFTGAHIAKPGLFEVAHGGTIFLDEVSGMSPNLQARLLRVLQERQVRRVGGTKFTHVDVRVIAASNQNLEDLCRQGTFREDLYYRLNVIPIALPPLRVREGDILLLANEFVTRFVHRVRPEAGSVPMIDPSAADVLMRYPWPGNVRELQNIMERAAVLVDGHTVMSAHLPDRLLAGVQPNAVLTEAASFKQAKQQAVETFERNFLMDLLKRNDGHMSRAAREAGVDRKTIERMVKKHGLRGAF